MSEEIQTQENQSMEISVPQQQKDDKLEALSSDNNFIPRLQFMSSRAEKCEAGEFPINHFAMIDNSEYMDLGEEVDILIIAWRPLALDTGGDDVVSCYHPNFDENNQPTGLFKEIQDRSYEKDSGCMFGPQYLVYLPEVQKFATFFCGSKTLRNETRGFNNRLGKAATLRGKHIQTKRYSYYSASIYDCTSVFALPEQVAVDKAANDFLNPPEQDVEVVSEEEAESTDREQ